LDLPHLQTFKERVPESINNKFDSDFQKFSSFLISSALIQNQNLWIDSSLNINESVYYKSALYTFLYFFYNENIASIKSNVLPEIGELYQSGKIQYKVTNNNIQISSSEEKFIQVEYITKGSLKKKTIPISSFHETYFKISEGPRVGTKTDIKPVLELMREISGKQMQITNFEKKFAIIASKNHFEEAFESHEIKSFPYNYVTKNEVIKSTFQFNDVQFFLASDYETIQEHVLDNGINLDYILIIGNHKHSPLENDLLRGDIKNAIFICNLKPQITELLKWSWTYPELNMSKVKSHKTIIVEDETFQASVNKFFCEISSLERKYGIHLNHINKHLSDMFNFVSPHQSSTVNDYLAQMEDSFCNHLHKMLSSEFTTLGLDSKDIETELISIYRQALNSLNFDNNPKTNYLLSNPIRDAHEIDYFLIPGSQKIAIWKENTHVLFSEKKVQFLQSHLQDYDPYKVEIINIRKFKDLLETKTILVPGLENKELFRLLHAGRHKVIWLLYKDEYKKYLQYLRDYELETYHELNSEERLKLTGIEFTGNFEITNIETLQDEHKGTFDKLFDYEVNKKTYSRINKYDQSPKTLIFRDGSKANLYNHTQVVLIEGEEMSLCEVSGLLEGDMVRVYDGQTREVLEAVLLENDHSGVMKEIYNKSKFWKERLRDFLDTEFKFAYKNNLAKIATCFDVSEDTVLGWLDRNSKTKFPQKIESIKELDLFSDEESDQIIDSCKKYNAIKIDLGRDFSSELKNFLITGNMGEILSKFDKSIAHKIADINMPIREFVEAQDTLGIVNGK